MSTPVDIHRLLRDQAWLRRIARELAIDADLAGDAVQEACAAALVTPPRSERTERSWFATVIRRSIARHRRDASRREARERRVAATSGRPPPTRWSSGSSCSAA